ncbi:MAG TPA: hypothetical protein VFM65_07690, partial [Flavobacteriaceae bacterium]|nr:hypothetical protein [Flavobacteriaceae bacterium]
MKKYCLFFCCSLLLISCEDFDVVDNARLEFTGTVTDQVGNPIPGTYVYLEGFDVSENEILGENFTDNSGNFRVVSLKTSTN